MIVAALDLGSNTLKLTVAEIGAAGELKVLAEHAPITRIGEGLDKNGFLLDGAQERTLKELVRLAALARSLGAKQIRCVGTAGLRGASNAPAFLERVKDQAGIEVEIIDGLREAELAFRSPSEQFGPGPVLVIDLGGRSTELISGTRGAIYGKVSLEVGSVRLTERLLKDDPPHPSQLTAAAEYMRGLLAAAPQTAADARLVGVSGSIIALLGLELGIHEMDVLAVQGEGQILHRSAVEAQLAEFSALTAKERVRGTILPPLRADVILGGMIIVLEIFRRYGRDEMLVTGRGVRYGLLYELARR